jgi:hypothetical protein
VPKNIHSVLTYAEARLGNSYLHLLVFSKRKTLNMKNSDLYEGNQRSRGMGTQAGAGIRKTC